MEVNHQNLILPFFGGIILQSKTNHDGICFGVGLYLLMGCARNEPEFSIPIRPVIC
jgi:hypothetical protein